MQKTLFLFLCLFSFVVHGQILKPAKLYVEPTPQTVNVGDEVDIFFNVTIDKNWYVYSTGFDADCGPVPMSMSFEPHASFKVVGSLQGIQHKEKYDETFGCDVLVFVGKGQFKQRIKILNAKPVIRGSFDGQVCSDLDGRCVLFDGDFVVDHITVKEPSAGTPVVTPKQEQKSTTTNDSVVTHSENRIDFAAANSTPTRTSTEKIEGPILDDSLVTENPAEQSFIGFFLLSFIAGLAALLTPCVFPMIPMTVSYFTAPGRTRFHALLYGLSIIVIYTLIGAALAPLMGPETANHLSTEWLPNLIFFLVFIIFGLSFLGLFEITLPSSLVTSADRQADKGGFVGLFFMAFTLVLVSFSCTGPLVGSILVSSAGGEFLKPIIGMFGFSLAFAIPFTLFAFFPGWLSTLPKSGGWLNSVKVVLGFLEIALAFKFLSIADQAFHWRILDREVNLAIWIVISILIGVYLLKGFRLMGDTGKDAEDKRIGVPRLMLAMSSFIFAVYLIPGMWGAPLKALAGYLPPMYTHDFDLLAANRESSKNEICDIPLHADFLHLPHGLQGYFDYKQALQCARQQNKPLFIDFTGHGCTNCREMEAAVWSDPLVLQRLQNDFVVVALYVDDKTLLPKGQWYTSSYDDKIKKTIGKQNADLQIRRLNNNAQPLYVLVGADERVLVTPYGYNRSVEDFVGFLEAGKTKYKQLYRH